MGPPHGGAGRICQWRELAVSDHDSWLVTRNPICPTKAICQLRLQPHAHNHPNPATKSQARVPVLADGTAPITALPACKPASDPPLRVAVFAYMSSQRRLRRRPTGDGNAACAGGPTAASALSLPRFTAVQGCRAQTPLSCQTHKHWQPRHQTEIRAMAQAEAVVDPRV